MPTPYLQQTFGLGGRTVLITGSARGIGAAIALAVGRAGARVILNDLEAAACQDTLATLTAEGIDAQVASFDVADFEAVKTATEALDQRGRGVDVLVSNAGNQNRKPLVEMSTDEWQTLMSVHVNGGFNCSRAVLPGMMRRGFGRIVVMSSVASEASMPNLSAYCTAKGALSALTRSIAVEYGAYGVTANAVAPGFVRTDFTEALQRRADFNDKIRESVPCGRWASTEDIAPVVLFLASPAAGFINGQTLVVDGGMLARM